MIPGGYYIKARCIKDSIISKSAPCVREIWDYLLREATYTEIKYNGFGLKRGQLFKSYNDIRNDLSWYVGYRKVMYSLNQIKHSMKLLMNDHMIVTMKQPRGVVITICKYNEYQDPKNYESTNDQPMINQPSPSINKKVKKERINNSVEFDIFWNIYAKKNDRKKCETKWNKISNDDKLKIINVLPEYIKATPDSQFRKNPITYLNNESWNNEAPKENKSSDDLWKAF